MTTCYFDGSIRQGKDARWGVLLSLEDGTEIERRGRFQEWKIHLVEARALDEARRLVDELGIEGPVHMYGDDRDLMRRQESCDRFLYAWIPGKLNEAHRIASG